MSLKSFLIATSLFGLAACQSTVNEPPKEQQIALTGTWQIEAIAGKAVIDYSPAQLIFSEDGKLSGNNSCNNFFGSYIVEGSSISLTPAGSTMKACVDALMAQEQQVMTNMPEVSSLQLSKGKLRLNDSEGKTLFIMSKI
ncbi:META domain-containing protein [Shewanella sp. UCD-KL12]|uniref:META domain-containing protein n=1 Tax=Shewanella sp. UCD-KL12 TaxID=1917163 RepID=UPI000970C170|nr:META domain-containing protein [Shewanella sp. UCD-KL12]